MRRTMTNAYTHPPKHIRFRRAITQGALITLIIIVATALLIFWWLAKEGLILNKTTNDNVCRVSLRVQSWTKFGWLDTPIDVHSNIKNACTLRTLEIGKDRVSLIKQVKVLGQILTKHDPFTIYLNGKPGLVYSKPTDQIVNSVFAESMRRCWYLGLEGSQPIFNSRSFYDNKRVCLVCDVINVNVDGTFGEQQTLSQYLSSATIPGSPKTYYDYLFSPRVFTLLDDNEKPNGEALSGSEQCLERAGISKDINVTRGTYTTVLFRDFARVYHDSCIATYTVPSADLRGLCDYVAN